MKLHLKARTILPGIVLVASVLLPFSFAGYEQLALGGHFPWDQAHDTFSPNPGDGGTDPGPGGQCKAGSPLEVATGNFIYSAQDLLISALGPDIDITRTYNSRDMRNGSFGHGWVFTHDTRLVETTDGVLLSAICRQGDGKRERFVRNVDGSFASPSHLFSTLVKNANDTFTLTEKDGTTRRFDVDGRLVALEDRNGNSMGFNYDATGFLISLREASGRTLTFSKGANGKIDSITDPAGRVLRYTYDLEGNLVTAADFLGNITRYAYDAKHNLLQVIDPKGNIVQKVTYDASDRVTTFIEDSETWTVAYFPGQKKTTKKDSSGNIWTLIYNDNGNIISRMGPLGGVETTSYDANFNPAQITDKNGVNGRLTYDEKGNLLTVVEAVGLPEERTIAFEYEPKLSQVSKIVDGTGGVTRYEHDERRNITTITNQAGGVIRTTYNDQGQVTSVTDENGNTVTLSYDSVGNLTSRSNAEGEVTSFAYDAAGNLVSVTQAVGTTLEQTLLFTYDNHGQQTSYTNGAGDVYTRAYDENENLVQIGDPTGVSIAMTYDANNQVAQISDPQNGSTSFAYGLRGSLVEIRNALGNSTIHGLDKAGQVISITNRLGFKTQFTYDGNGNILTVTSPSGESLAFDYDGLNRRTSRTNARGETKTFSYNARDDLVREVDASGHVTEDTYDVLGRLVRTKTSDDEQIYEYDAVGNLVRAADADSEVLFTYDRESRLISTTTNGPVQPSVTLSYGYDELGRRISLSASIGGTHRYEYDAADRLIGITTPSGQTFTMAYDGGNRRTKIMYPNSIVATNSYDSSGKLSRISHVFGTAELLRLDYEYNALGDITKIIQDQVRQLDFSYDAIRQLVKGGTSAAPETYVYDSTGNRTSSHLSSTYTYDVADRLAADDGFVYQYDANGNLISRTEKSSGSISTYAYDRSGKLVGATVGGTSASYSYDALGRRISKTVAGVTTTYIYDGENVLLEFDDADSLAAVYTHDNSVDRPLMVDRRGGKYYYHADHQGSVMKITDASGAVANSYEYEAFGAIKSRSETVQNSFSFVGREFDLETGLYYYRARHLDPRQGRFIQEDPSQDEGAYISAESYVNNYLYVLNNPVNFNDASGQSLGLVLVGGAWVAVQVCIRNPACVRAVIQAGAQAIAALLAAAAAVDILNEAKDVITREVEHQRYKDFCDKRAPRNPGNDASTEEKCSFLSDAISHASRCIDLIREWDRRWNPGRHSDKLTKWKTRIDNLKKDYEANCKPKQCELPAK